MGGYRITEGLAVSFITFTVKDWLPVFIDEKAISILIDSFKFCIERKNLRVNAFVIMPTHLHAVVFDADINANQLNTTLTDLRKITGRRLSDYVDQHYSERIALVLRGNGRTDRERQFWQPGWHAEGIFSYPFWQQKVDYIHWNPCRKGLVRSPQDWRYSSAAFWMDGKQVDLPVSDVMFG
jgi:REP element-mobilizing transposase RayT